MSAIAGTSMIASGTDAFAPIAAAHLPPGLADQPDYEILRELGQGGMGVVYLARNKLMGRLEVLKIVSSHLTKRHGVLERFLAEIRNAAKLHHPNVVTAYAAIRMGESLVLAMEYVEGLDLAKIVKVRGPLPVAHACYYAYQVALGLQHAHEHGMVHRDIKPGNLILARQGTKAVVKVLAFGLAKLNREVPADGALTYEGQMLGTPDFIAPEQSIDARNADIRADIYSLGCTLYYLLSGAAPFKGMSLYDVLQAHHSRDAVLLNLTRRDVSVELASLVAKMMAKDPEQRFQTPAQVADALKTFFRKGAVDSKDPLPMGLQAVLSEPNAGQAELHRPATKATSDASTSSAPRAARARTETMWEGLIKLEDAEAPEETLAVVRTQKGRWPRWFWPVAATAFSIAMISLGTVIYVITDHGRIKITIEGPKTDVTVDGEQIIVSSLGDYLTLHTGDHKLEVRWRDGKLRKKTFTIRRGEADELHVEYEPTESDRARTNRNTETSKETAPGDNGDGPAPPLPGKSPRSAVTTSDYLPKRVAAGDASGLPILSDNTRSAPGDNAQSWSSQTAKAGEQSPGTPPLAKKAPDAGPAAVTSNVTKPPVPSASSAAGSRAPVPAGNPDPHAAEAATLPVPRAQDLKEPMEEIVRVPIRPLNRRLAFSPDSKFVALDCTSTIRLVELESGRLIRDIDPGRPLLGESNILQSAVIMPGGNIIASYEDQAIRLWDPTGSRMIRHFPPGPQGDQFRGLLYSEKGRWLVGRSKAEIRIWDVETGKPRKRYPTPPSPVRTMDLHPNGQWIVTVHEDRAIRIWDALSGASVSADFPYPTDKLGPATFTPKGNLLCRPVGIPELFLVNPANGVMFQVFEGIATNVIDAAIFPGERYIAAIYADNILRVWNATTGVVDYQKPFEAEVWRLGISPNGQFAVVMFPSEAIVFRVKCVPAASSKRKR
jgi:serine/threonine protein kinase